MYEIFFADRALRQLEKLEKTVQKRIIVAIERIRIRPENFVKRLVGAPYYKLRVGDYRVILDIKHGEMVIMVVYVGHRKNVYENVGYSH